MAGVWRECGVRREAREARGREVRRKEGARWSARRLLGREVRKCTGACGRGGAGELGTLGRHADSHEGDEGPAAPHRIPQRRRRRQAWQLIFPPLRHRPAPSTV